MKKEQYFDIDAMPPLISVTQDHASAGTGNGNARAVIRTSPNGLEERYKTLTEASIKNGWGDTRVARIMKGNAPNTTGYEWRYADDTKSQ